MPIEDCKINNVHVIYCLPMHVVLYDIRISHASIWLLDVVGAELEILCIGATSNMTYFALKQRRGTDHKNKATDLLALHSYEPVWQYGRNSRYKRKGFMPSPRKEEERYTRGFIQELQGQNCSKA